jgi:monofunctional glycosyltransferase
MNENEPKYDFEKPTPFNKKRTVWTIIAVLLLVALPVSFIVYFFLSLPDVSYLKTENPKNTALMEISLQQALQDKKKYRIKQEWVSFQNIPDLLKKAVRIAEDASFYAHEGVDFDELKESIKKNWEEGRYARGGSTITQQLAKNLFLSPRKSLLRKVKEYFIARRLEKELSKNRIFHLYLNLIQFGPDVFGVQAASKRYFDKPVSNLNLEEIVRLTSVIPRPMDQNPTKSTRWLNWRCRWILDKLRLYGYIDEQSFEETITLFQN